MRKKLKSKKGFTLIEMIACTATLVLVTLICTTGMNMATKSYNESMFESNSQKLEYMLNLAVGDILRYSHDVEVDDGTITFVNEVYGVNGVGGGGIKLDAEGHFVLVKSPTNEALLIATANYADGMYVADFSLEYDSVTKIYTGEYKIKSSLTSQERLVEFTYKSIVESI